MIAVDDIPKDTLPPFNGDPRNDQWSEWKPRWDTRAEPHALQEKHSPTEVVTRRTGSAEERSQRRIVDARLWEAMSPAQQDAAAGIARACETMGRGLGYAASKWTGMPGGGRGDIGAAHARLIAFYVEWTKACHREKVSHAMIVDILVQGHSCAESDRNRRVRKGTSRQNLFDGLDLYCRLKGWRA